MCTELVVVGWVVGGMKANTDTALVLSSRLSFAISCQYFSAVSIVVRLTINRDKVDLILHGVVWLRGGGDLGLTLGGVHQLPPDLHLVGEVGVEERDQPALPLMATLGEESHPASGH